MKIKPLFFLGLSLFLFWACAPQKTIPPLREPVAPPPLEVLDAESIFNRAEGMFAKQLYEEALLHYTKYIQEFPQGDDAPVAWMRLGDIYTRFENFQEARQAYRMLIETHPENPLSAEAMIRKLDAFNQDGMYPEAIQYSFEIADSMLSPSQLSRKDMLLGDAFLATGSHGDAFYFYSLVYTRSTGADKDQSLTKIKTVLPHLNMIHTDQLLRRLSDPVLKGHLLYHMGVLNLDAGRTVDAISALSELIAHDPDHEHAESAQNLLKEIYLSSIQSPYTIGCVLPLSGPYKIYGTRALKGIELALNRHNIKNPHAPIRIIIKDTASNPYQAVLAVQALDEEKVAAIIGPILSAEPAALEAQGRSIPIILFTQKKDITQIGDFVFRNFITPEMQANTMANFAVAKLGLKRFAVLYPHENYGETFMNLFWDAVLSLGGNIAGIESYDPELTDFAESIKKLVGLFYDMPEDLKISFELLPEKPNAFDSNMTYFSNPFIFFAEFFENSSELFYGWQPVESGPLAAKAGPESAPGQEPQPIIDFDAIFIPDAPQKAGLIIPQLAYYDIEDVVLIGTNLWHSDKLLDMTRRYIQGAVLPDGFFADCNAGHVQAFTRRFENTFGEKPGFIEAVAFDSAAILLQILSDTDIHFKSRIKDELLSIVDFAGVTGRTSFDFKGDALKNLYILKISGNRFIEVEIP